MRTAVRIPYYEQPPRQVVGCRLGNGSPFPEDLANGRTNLLDIIVGLGILYISGQHTIIAQKPFIENAACSLVRTVCDPYALDVALQSSGKLFPHWFIGFLNGLLIRKYRCATTSDGHTFGIPFACRAMTVTAGLIPVGARLGVYCLMANCSTAVGSLLACG